MSSEDGKLSAGESCALPGTLRRLSWRDEYHAAHS